MNEYFDAVENDQLELLRELNIFLEGMKDINEIMERDDE